VGKLFVSRLVSNQTRGKGFQGKGMGGRGTKDGDLFPDGGLRKVMA